MRKLPSMVFAKKLSVFVTIVFLCGCGNNPTTKKTINSVVTATDSKPKNKHDEKWNGTYSFTINGDTPDWRDAHDITLTISEDSILYRAVGYQIYQDYILSATQSGDDALKLQYVSAKDNTESAVLNKTKDFGTVNFNGKVYSWSSPYLNISFGAPSDQAKNRSYVLSKFK